MFYYQRIITREQCLYLFYLKNIDSKLAKVFVIIELI